MQDTVATGSPSISPTEKSPVRPGSRSRRRLQGRDSSPRPRPSRGRGKFPRGAGCRICKSLISEVAMMDALDGGPAGKSGCRSPDDRSGRRLASTVITRDDRSWQQRRSHSSPQAAVAWGHGAARRPRGRWLSRGDPVVPPARVKRWRPSSVGSASPARTSRTTI